MRTPAVPLVRVEGKLRFLQRLLTLCTISDFGEFLKVIEKQKERAEKYDEETDFGTLGPLCPCQELRHFCLALQLMRLWHAAATLIRAVMCSAAPWSKSSRRISG